MKGFAVVPPSIVPDDRKLKPWIERALAFAETLPKKK